MRLTCEGEDNLGKFTVFVPYKCEVCDKPVEAALLYRKTLTAHLQQQGIQPKDVIAFRLKGMKAIANHIGITCGCYAKLQRQIAHISNKRSQRSRS